MSLNLRSIYDFWKLNSYQEAEALAVKATEEHPGHTFLAYDYGSGVSPQWGIIEPPCVGDDTSEAINGDYYPLGKVERIGKDYKRIMVKGKWWYRRKLAPTWVRGYMVLVKGTYDERNPHV